MTEEMTKPPEPSEPPIHAAARTGDIAALERFVRGGVDINLATDLEVDNGPHLRQLTPLMVAARSIDGASVETLRWLIDHGADLHAKSEGGETAAYYAAGKGGRWHFHSWRVVPDHASRLAFLLDAGLSPDETNFVGRSLVAEACEAGDIARLEVLLSRGASLSSQIGLAESGSSSEASFWREVAPAGMTEEQIHELIASMPRGNPGGRSSFTIPLFCAASSGSAECVCMLLRAGVDVNERDESGQVALMHAGSAAVAVALMDAGLDANVRTLDGEDAIAVLLRGASCDNGLCSTSRFDVVRALMSRGGRLGEVGDRYGTKRLYDAAFRHDVDTVEFLLSVGCRACEIDERGRTALHGICWQGEYSDPYTNAACEQIIRALVAAGADVNARDEGGHTPLREAVDGDWGNQTAVRVLIELGALVDTVGDDGRTPLMSAAGEGDVGSVTLLLAAGADPHRQATDGLTAKDYATEHLRSWETISRAMTYDPSLGTAEEQRARHEDALQKARECAALFDEPPTATDRRDSVEK